jgi:ubiquitin carboxyl-terminal hydrolase 4/11/15
VPAFGFRLRVVSKDGLGDPREHWLSRSVGRLLAWDDEAPAELEDGCSLAIDWHLAVLKGCFDSAARPVVVHPSVAIALGTEDQTLSLGKCLDTFAAEEKIEEAYCSQCKAHRHASLKTCFWRLPPVLVVHLKRFSFSAYSRRKLHNLVKFPLDHLDLEGYVVQDTAADSPPAGPPNGGGAGGSGGGGAEEGWELGGGRPSSSSAYALYAVVHHLGAMSSGHYVASIKCRKTGKWHCFNDNVVVPISDKDVVTESAYILFYMRKDMASVNLGDVYPTNSTGPAGLNEEEFVKIMKKRDRSCQVM